MAQLIDKDALVAEIEIRIKNLYPKGGQGMVVTKILKDHYEDLLSFLNSIEVKEVDLEKEIETQWNKFVDSEGEVEQFSEIAKHFFELGLSVSNKAQKEEKV